MKKARTGRSTLFTILWIILIVLVVLWLNLPSDPVFQALVSDSGVYAYIGSAIVHGQVPYRDVWEQKPPVGFYLNALAVLLFGQTPWGIWWFNLIWVALSASVFFLVIKKMFGAIPAATASLIFVLDVMHPSIFQGGNLMEIYALLPQVLVVGVAHVFLLTRKDRWIFLAGVLTSMAFMIKQTSVALGFSSILVMLTAGLFKREFRRFGLRLAISIGGFLVPLAIAVLYFQLAGALNDFISGAFLYSLVYVSVGAPFLWSIKHTALTVFPGMFISKLYFIAAISFFLYFILNFKRLILLFSPGKTTMADEHKDHAPVELCMLAVFIAMPIELVFTSLGGRNLGHYFITMVPAVTTAIAYIFWRLIYALQAVRIRRGPASLLLLLGWVILGFFALLWSGAAFKDEIPTSTQMASITKIFSNQVILNDLDQYIVSQTGPDDPVLFWHIHLGKNFIIQRRPPQKILFPAEMFIPAQMAESNLKEFMGELQQNPPKFILVQKKNSVGLPFVNVPVDQMCPNGACIPEVASGMKQPGVIEMLQVFRQYFLDHYTFDRQIYDILVYQRNP